MRPFTILSILVVTLLIPFAISAQEVSPTTPAPTDVVEDNRYRVGAGDLLKIEVFGVDEFNRTVRVLDDGTVTLPLLGNFSMDGQTLAEAEAEMFERLKAAGYDLG